MSLRKTVLTAFCLASSVVLAIFAAGGAGTQVGSTSMKILARAGITAAPDWVTNTVYANGDYVTANTRIFMCLTAGTSTNTGTGPSAVTDTTDGTVTWRPALMTTRKGLVFVNMATSSTAYVYLAERAAVTNSGIALGPNGCSVSFSGTECPQSEFYAVYTGGQTGTVTTFEW